MSSKPYFLAICAVFRNEAKNLSEWLEHHIREGVDHLFMVDQNSNDNFMPVVQPYIDGGLLTLMVNPKGHSHLDIINNYFFP